MMMDADKIAKIKEHRLHMLTALAGVPTCHADRTEAEWLGQLDALACTLAAVYCSGRPDGGAALDRVNRLRKLLLIVLRLDGRAERMERAEAN